MKVQGSQISFNDFYPEIKTYKDEYKIQNLNIQGIFSNDLEVKKEL